MMRIVHVALITGSIVGAMTASAVAADEKMRFFITSVGGGKGGDLGGLAGADAHCSKLANAAGVSSKTWRAYLSTTMIIDRSKGRPYKIMPGVNARDRISDGPWYSAKGQLLAKDVDDLHSNAKIDEQMGLDERGNTSNARGDKPNKHDILTGSDPQGRHSTPEVTPRAATGRRAAGVQLSLAITTGPACSNASQLTHSRLTFRRQSCTRRWDCPPHKIRKDVRSELDHLLPDIVR